jgi:tripartite-type tricarboxylate transporter receptor subunit TctC
MPFPNHNQNALFRPCLRRTAAQLLLSLIAAVPLIARADSKFPDKPIRIVLSTPAGGPLDALARISAEAASKALGQQIIIDNKPGASGGIAVSYVLKQPPDGYTLYMTADATFTLIPLVRKMNYRPIDDFSFVGSLVFAPQVLAVPANTPSHNLQEFIAKAKSEPGKMNYGMMLGVPQHLDFERFKKVTGTDLVLVPYTGGAPIVSAMLGGQIDATLMNASLFTDWIKQGKIRALATTSKKRMAALPDVPTFAEAGLPTLNLDDGVVYLLAGPAGMARPVLAKLNEAFAAALRDVAVQKRLEAMGYEIKLQDGDALKAELQRALPENEKMVKALNIKFND